MKGRLAQRAAIVTGAGMGIGRAIALRLLEEGARVVAVDRNVDALATLPAGDSLLALESDVTMSGAPQHIVSRCIERWGGVQILVNNAGLGNAPPILETTDADYDRWMEANLGCTFRLTREAIPSLLESRGVVVNIASSIGLRGFRRQSAYSMAKAGVIGLTRNLAAEYAASGLRFNAIAPGLIATPQTADRMKTARFQATIVGTTPMGRAGTPEEIAGATAFLCSDDAGFVTGQVLAVDGGATSSVYVAEAIVQCWIDAHPD
jgi:meso-butanediol dehydrogenase/(S,S)-butanediol dehydrogenase/diacetyl reductase